MHLYALHVDGTGTETEREFVPVARRALRVRSGKLCEMRRKLVEQSVVPELVVGVPTGGEQHVTTLDDVLSTVIIIRRRPSHTVDSPVGVGVGGGDSRLFDYFEAT